VTTATSEVRKIQSITAARTGKLSPAARVQPWLRSLIYLAPALAVFAIFSYAPFFEAIWLSLHVTDATGNTVRFNAGQYFSRILNLNGRGTEYLQSIWISAQFSLMVVPAGIAAGVALAQLAAAKLRHIGIFRTIFTSSIAISLASAGVIFAMMYSPVTGLTGWIVDLLQLPNEGVLNNAATALPAVAFMTIWTGLGFNFIIALAGIQAIPQDVYESASMDGASGWHAFWSITLPLLAPTLLFLLVVNTIGSLQAFTQFNVLINGAGPEGSTNVYVYSTFRTFWYDNRYGFASAMSIVLFVILFVLSFIQFRGFDSKVHYQ
jgi:sn-glycerol 3-phosphate transport system permease protein